MSTEQNKAVVRRYYDEMWNRWDMALVDEIISEDMAFRGSLSVNAEGRDGFEYYMELVRTAFPDFHNQIEELIAEGDKVVAHLTYTGTYQGPLFGVAPTGKRVTYTGTAIFRLADGKIVDGWVNGTLWDVCGRLAQSHRWRRQT